LARITIRAMNTHDGFGEQMAAASWRHRQTWAQHQGRTIERQADGLRQALLRLADGPDGLRDVEQMASALRQQVEIVRAQSAAVARSRELATAAQIHPPQA